MNFIFILTFYFNFSIEFYFDDNLICKSLQCLASGLAQESVEDELTEEPIDTTAVESESIESSTDDTDIGETTAAAAQSNESTSDTENEEVNTEPGEETTESGGSEENTEEIQTESNEETTESGDNKETTEVESGNDGSTAEPEANEHETESGDNEETTEVGSGNDQSTAEPEANGDETTETESDNSSTESETIAEATEEPTESPATEGPPSFTCQAVGRFEVPNNCEKYYFCWDITGDQTIFDCSHGRAFDPKTELCVSDFSVCASAPTCEFDRQILANSEDNTTYFECKEHKDGLLTTFELKKENCESGREFDGERGYCVVASTGNESSDESDGLDCDEPGVFIDTMHDDRYYECILKSVSKGTFKLKHHKCSKYHVFSMADKRCVALNLLV